MHCPECGFVNAEGSNYCQKCGAFLADMTEHHEGEDQIIFPYLASVGVPSDLLTAMDDEHHAMADALRETREALSAYASSGSAGDAR